ncbi:YusW family protein [Paenibacillus sp. JDR-2]|uniref:YusW family protein n=1 Tax=Paenibacillus sp. (strain JDR-2) TaxID=324057 RepID=UPI0001666A26|nr:YusW family protein [Paenibacillus sp. JDR-2]ACT03149.1 hypothetical protein Pjdr2_4528 [Paenibacillus sp. JDR-2]
MKKKISYILIGAICSSILSYGLVAYADNDSSATKEDNRAASDTYVVPSKADEAVVKLASAQPSNSETPIQLEQLKALDLKIDGDNVKVKIELEKEESKTESKVEIKIAEDRKQYLTGDEATQFIQQLLAAIKIQANMDKQQVMDALFTHFAVEPAKVELNIDIKLKDRPEELKFKEEKDEDADVEADKDDTKVQTMQSNVQENQKAQLAANDQPTKQEQKKALIAQKKALQQAWQKAHKEQQEKKKQQKQLNRSDRDHDQNKGQKGDEDDDDQGEDHDRDGDHGKHQEHKEHDDED